MFLVSACTICVMLTMLYASTKQRKMLTPEGDTKQMTTNGALLMFVAILVTTSTLRYGYIDTYAYKIMYEMSRNNLVYVNSAPWGVEAGWLYLLYYLNCITDNPKLMLFLTALVVNTSIVLVCKKYSSNAWFSLFVYYCIAYMDTNNGVRQCFAMGITTIAFYLLLLKKKQYLWFILLVYLASLFHESAIYVLLIALLVIGRPFNLRILATLVASVVFIMAPELVSGIMQEASIDSKYNFYLSYSAGMGFLRCLIISIVPLTLAFWYYFKKNKYREKISEQDGVLINILVVNSALYIMGLYMAYWARLAFYTSFAPIVLLPKLIDGVFYGNDRKWIKMIALWLYFIFFAYYIYVNTLYGAIGDFRIDWS